MRLNLQQCVRHSFPIPLQHYTLTRNPFYKIHRVIKYLIQVCFFELCFKWNSMCIVLILYEFGGHFVFFKFDTKIILFLLELIFMGLVSFSMHCELKKKSSVNIMKENFTVKVLTLGELFVHYIYIQPYINLFIWETKV